MRDQGLWVGSPGSCRALSRWACKVGAILVSHALTLAGRDMATAAAVAAAVAATCCGRARGWPASIKPRLGQISLGLFRGKRGLGAAAAALIMGNHFHA